MRVRWYRSPIDPPVLRGLMQRSDLKGWFQSVGPLLLLAGGRQRRAHLAPVRARHLGVGLAAALFLHGTMGSIYGAANHELTKGTVFRTKVDRRPRSRGDRRLTVYPLRAVRALAAGAVLALWSRLGTYDPAHLDHLLFGGGAAAPDSGRRLFEYWMHAACIIPLACYRLVMPMMRRRAEGRTAGIAGGYATPRGPACCAPCWRALRREDRSVRRISVPRGNRPAPGGTGTTPRSPWSTCTTPASWPSARRVNFQRVYDLRDRVLPPWVDRREPAPEEALRALLEISSRALSICTVAQVANYCHAKQADARPLLDRLIADGRLVPVAARLADGADHELVVHRDNLPLLQRAADGDLRPRRTTFLSPFDSLFWASARACGARPAIPSLPPSGGESPRQESRPLRAAQRGSAANGRFEEAADRPPSRAAAVRRGSAANRRPRVAVGRGPRHPAAARRGPAANRGCGARAARGPGHLAAARRGNQRWRAAAARRGSAANRGPRVAVGRGPGHPVAGRRGSAANRGCGAAPARGPAMLEHMTDFVEQGEPEDVLPLVA